MSNWLKLNPSRLNEGEPGLIRGVEVVLFLSPYDVPEAVRGRFDQSSQKFFIEFKYLTGAEEPDEPLDTVSHDNHVALKVGRYSQRLYRIEVDVVGLGAEEVGIRILNETNDAIERLSGEGKRERNRGHYEVARRVISDHKDQLFKDLVAQCF